MNSGKYFLIFVLFLFCIVITMYSGDIGYKVGTADGWIQVGAIEKREFLILTFYLGTEQAV